MAAAGGVAGGAAAVMEVVNAALPRDRHGEGCGRGPGRCDDRRRASHHGRCCAAVAYGGLRAVGLVLDSTREVMGVGSP